MSTFDGSHGLRVVIYGTTELAELAYLSLREMNIDCVGFIDGSSRVSFLSCPVSSPERISRWQFDRVLITDLEHAAACEEQLVQSGVPAGKGSETRAARIRPGVSTPDRTSVCVVRCGSVSEGRSCVRRARASATCGIARKSERSGTCATS